MVTVMADPLFNVITLPLSEANKVYAVPVCGFTPALKFTRSFPAKTSLNTSEAERPSMSVPATRRKSSSATPEVNLGTFVFAMPVDKTAAVPSDKWPLAELASATSDKLLAARKLPTFARFTIFASDTFLVVAVPLTSTIGTTSVDAGVPEKGESSDILRFAILSSSVEG